MASCFDAAFVTRQSDGKAIRRSLWTTQFGERVGENVVEGLDHGMSELLRNPDALLHACIDLRYLRITPAGIRQYRGRLEADLLVWAPGPRLPHCSAREPAEMPSVR